MDLRKRPARESRRIPRDEFEEPRLGLRQGGVLLEDRESQPKLHFSASADSHQRGKGIDGLLNTLSNFTQRPP
jgi:hypothetical protein